MKLVRLFVSVLALLGLTSLAQAQTATPFCFGDGTSTLGNCPCGAGQNGAVGEGCANSTGAGGLMTATGSPCVTLLCGPDTLSLAVSGLPLTTTCILIQSATVVPDVVFGDGIRCIGGNILRLYVVAATAGSVKFPPAGPTISARSAALGDVIPPLGTRHYQVYYRDPIAAHCPPATFNITNGMSVVWR